MESTKVIAISGASGCGKTTIIRQLSRELGCPKLQFDGYADHSSYPQDMKTWYTNGADVSLITTPGIAEALQAIKAESPPCIFVEEPFGRQRSCIAPYIDHVVLLDTPLEICLSRVIKRNIQNPRVDSNSSVPNYLDKYESHLRDIYLDTVNQVRGNCDLIIKGVHPVSETVDIIKHWLENSTSELA